jgi:RHS repeat-associated protein
MLYDGWNLIEEKNSVTDRCYIWGLDLSGTLDGAGGIGGLLAVDDEVSSKMYWYANDANGNVTALVDASTGAIVARYEYGPFGEPLRASGPLAKVNPFRWSSNYTENESGLVNGKLRWYRSSLGRWLSRDPSGERGGDNLYGFVRNNPLRFIDSLGLEVLAIFNVQVGLLSVTDLDTNESAMIRATAGTAELQNKFDKEWSSGGPIPRGDYEILDRIKDPNNPSPLDNLQDKYGVYDLDRKDSNPRDDGTGRGRGQFRLHPGYSTGCVVTDNLEDYQKVSSIINNTRTKQVKDAQGRARTFYGTMKVVSAPRPQEVNETKDKKRLQGPKKKSIWDLLFRQKADPQFDKK